MAARRGRFCGDNIGRCSGQGVTKVFRRDATQLGENRGAAFTLVFLDPPYGMGLGERALASAGEGGWIAPGATIVWEEEAAPLPPPGFETLDERRYGSTSISLRFAGAMTPGRGETTPGPAG